MTMNQTNPYLKTKVLTASPEELRMMLYEGALKFCRQGVEALSRKDYETSYTTLIRAQKIVMELSNSLNHKQAPELCDRLGALYTYIYRRLVDANFKRETSAINEAIELLEYEKQTWQMLMSRLNEEGFSRTAAAQATGTAGVPSTSGMADTQQIASQTGRPSIEALSIRVG